MSNAVEDGDLRFLFFAFYKKATRPIIFSLSLKISLPPHFLSSSFTLMAFCNSPSALTNHHHHLFLILLFFTLSSAHLPKFGLPDRNPAELPQPPLQGESNGLTHKIPYKLEIN